MVDIAEEVREVVVFHLGPGKTAITEEARLTHLGADSIDVYEVIMSLEEKFNINIDDRDAQRLVTIGDTIALIKSKVS
jgi:acyl carrier protein